MPTININRKQFEELVGEKLPIDKLKDRISMLGTDLDEITDSEIIVEIFSDRPDMLSEQGFARAFSSFISHKTGLRNYTAKDSKQKIIIDPSVKKVRPFTACAIVKNLKFDEAKLRIKTIETGKGPSFKRWNPVSRGMAHSIKKRTSHIKVVLEAT